MELLVARVFAAFLLAPARHAPTLAQSRQPSQRFGAFAALAVRFGSLRATMECCALRRRLGIADYGGGA
jgi:hypothetical protein